MEGSNRRVARNPGALLSQSGRPSTVREDRWNTICADLVALFCEPVLRGSAPLSWPKLWCICAGGLRSNLRGGSVDVRVGSTRMYRIQGTHALRGGASALVIAVLVHHPLEHVQLAIGDYAKQQANVLQYFDLIFILIYVSGLLDHSSQLSQPGGVAFGIARHQRQSSSRRSQEVSGLPCLDNPAENTDNGDVFGWVRQRLEDSPEAHGRKAGHA